MDVTGLAFFTVEDLVGELMRRKTFLGVVIHSATDVKGARWDSDRTFKVHFNSNLEAPEAARLLCRVSDHIALNHG
jgi:hypothetical protein